MALCSDRLGWGRWGLAVEVGIVCVGGGGGGETLFITSKYDFAGWLGGQMALEFGIEQWFHCSKCV